MQNSLILCGDRPAAAVALSSVLRGYLQHFGPLPPALDWTASPECSAQELLPGLWRELTAVSAPALITAPPLASPLTRDALVAEVARDFRLPVLALSAWEEDGVERLVALAAIARVHGVPWLGVVLGLGDRPAPDEATAQWLEDLTGLPLIGGLPAGVTDPGAVVSGWRLEDLPSGLGQVALEGVR